MKKTVIFMKCLELAVALLLTCFILSANATSKKILLEMKELREEFSFMQGLITPPEIYLLPVVGRSEGGKK
jgi:hypothetical protein